MKSALGIILISVTLTTIVLGGFMISHNTENHIQCPISIFGSNDCANIINPFKFALSHVNTIIGASAGIVISPLIFLIFAISMLLVLFVFGAVGPPQINFLRASGKSCENPSIASTQKWLNWLSVLEKRDPLVLSAAKI
jgi:hypothetical protein